VLRYFVCEILSCIYGCYWIIKLCLLTDRDEMSILYRGPSIAATYQVLVHLTKRFQRRRFFMNRPISNTNADWLISKKYSQTTEPLVYILYCIICMLMFHHACLSFSIKSLRSNLLSVNLRQNLAVMEGSTTFWGEDGYEWIEKWLVKRFI
jgi:hypothetical protein